MRSNQARPTRRGMRNFALTCSVAALAAACSQNDYSAKTIRGEASVKRSQFSESDYGVKTSRRAVSRGAVPKGGGVFKIGNPYKVAGRWYVPREEPNYDRVGTASWYGDDFHGRRTANGEIFDRYALTAAHPTLPLPSYVYVTNQANGRTVLVRVNDRGPYVNGRIIDLSHAAAQVLGYVGQGRAHVRVRYAGRAPLNGNDYRERQFLAQQMNLRSRDRRAEATTETLQIPEPKPVTLAMRQPQRDTEASWSRNGDQASFPEEAKPNTGHLAAAPRYASASAVDTTASITMVRPPPYGLGGPVSRGAGLDQDADTRAFVQFGVYSDLQYAERLRSQFGHLGPIEVAPLDTAPGAPVYRVRLGPVSPRNAEKILHEVSSSGINSGSIVLE